MFKDLRKSYQNYDLNRQIVIQKANFALHKAKQAIFALHRNEICRAEKILTEAEKRLSSLKKPLSKAPDLRYNGAYKAAIEEYVEAKLFWQVLKFGKIEKIKKLEIRFDDYLAGICDLTGELIRKMVLLAIEGRIAEIERIKDLIDEIVNELTKINLVGYLRHKYDEAKRNLEKAEEIIYELKTRNNKLNFN